MFSKFIFLVSGQQVEYITRLTRGKSEIVNKIGVIDFSLGWPGGEVKVTKKIEEVFFPLMAL